MIFFKVVSLGGLLLLFFILLRLGQILRHLRRSEVNGAVLSKQVVDAPRLHLKCRSRQYRLEILNESEGSFYDIRIDLALEADQQREMILSSERALHLPYPQLNSGEKFELLIAPDPLRDSGIELELIWRLESEGESHSREIYLPL